MRATFLFILCSICIVYSSQRRIEEFSRITKYELLHVTPRSIDEKTKLIEFDAFNDHYKVELTRNDDLITANIKHSHPSAPKHLSSMTESCHYHGRVLNTEAPSIASVSLCDKRGIRARITAYNETIILQPSAYYLDLAKQRNNDYTLSDELLVYRLSDFNGSLIQPTDGVDIPQRGSASVSQPLHPLSNEQQRRLAYSSANPAHVEVLIVSGPVRNRNYIEEYKDTGKDWYTELLDDYKDLINSVSAIYKVPNWGSSVGGTNSITVVLKELEIIESFTGEYADLKPNHLYTNCELEEGEYDDSDECAIDVSDFLTKKIQPWIGKKDVSTFDNVQFVTDIRFKNERDGNSISRTLGLGFVGAVCVGDGWSSSTVSVVPDVGGLNKAVGTLAHELGHNFGMAHDGQDGDASDCHEDDGLMGYGTTDDVFSTCSVRSMVSYFEEMNSLTCIGTGWTGQRTQNQYDTRDASDTTTTTTTVPNTGTTTTTTSTTATTATFGTSGTCVGISKLFWIFDGDWMKEDGITTNGKESYTFKGQDGSTYYLYYAKLSWDSVSYYWFISSVRGSTSVNARCIEQDLLKCSGKFEVVTSGGFEVFPSSVIDLDCGAAATCDHRECVGISGITDYNGQYDYIGCNGDYPYYKMDDADKYICWNTGYSRWALSSASDCTSFNYVSWHQSTDILGGGTSNKWLLPPSDTSNQWTVIGSISECNAAFSFEDLSCLEDTLYDDHLCVYSNNSMLWNGNGEFIMDRDLCREDDVVYTYTVYDTSSDVMESDGLNVDISEGMIKAVWYLSYHEKLKYSDGNEYIKEWIITKDKISISALAVCEKENLLECTSGLWKVQTMGREDELMLDAILMMSIDDVLTVRNGGCDEDVIVEKENSDGMSASVVVFVVSVVVVVLIVVIGCIWFRRIGTKGMGKHVEVADVEPDLIECSVEKDVNETI